MGITALLILFFLGIFLSTIGGLIGVVDAFQVSPVWGLLALLVPFALLVFWAKFFRTRKWARNSAAVSLGGLAVALLSLPFLGGFIQQRIAAQQDQPPEVVITPGEESPAEPLPAEEIPVDEAPVVDAPEDQAVAGEGFAEPLVPMAPQLSPIARAELIQSTDANERLQQIASSRPDPFSTVAVPPVRPVVPPPPPFPAVPPEPAQPATPGGGGTAGGGGAPGGGTAGGGTAGGGPVATAPGTPPGGNGQAVPPPLAPLPPLPQPTLAEAVQVTGVMTIGNENFAVVETSAGSQYVRAGQRVANGQVLIKRIDMRGSEPMVGFPVA